MHNERSSKHVRLRFEGISMTPVHSAVPMHLRVAMLFAGAWRAAFAIGCLILYSLFVEAGSPCLAQDPKITFHGDIGTGQASGASTGSMALSRYELNFGVARDLGRPCKAKAAYRVRVDRYLSPSTEYDFDLPKSRQCEIRHAESAKELPPQQFRLPFTRRAPTHKDE